MNELEQRIQNNITLAMCDSFISFLDAKPRTVSTYKGNIRLFINWLADQGITQPTREDVIQYRDELRTRCKPSTVQCYITSIRLFFDWTEQAGIYPNIAKHIKGAKIDKGHKKDYLTSAQVNKLLNSIDLESPKGLRDYTIILLMVVGGLRDIEVSRANIGDIQPLADNTVLYLQGKGHEERTDYIKLPSEVERKLREYLSTRDDGASARAPLFTSTSHRNQFERLTPRSISGIVKQRLVSAGFNSERLTAHSLRHTAVTLSLLAGNSLQEVQQFARHGNISTTQIYAHNLDRAKNQCEQSILDSIL